DLYGNDRAGAEPSVRRPPPLDLRLRAREPEAAAERKALGRARPGPGVAPVARGDADARLARPRDRLTPRAAVVVTGSELVRGGWRDANGPFLAAELTNRGLEPDRITIVGDEPDELETALREGLQGDLLVISGGLGPTHDDRTVELLARAAGLEATVDPELERDIEQISRRIAERFRRPYAEFEQGVRKQATVPEGGRVIGIAGTAPGLVLGEARAQGITVATAESCTGGLVAARLTSVAGASDVFRGGLVAYENDVKLSQLNVPEETLAAHGAVSAETAAAMAAGARESLGADVAVAVTGVAGPGGGTREKPVGLVYLHASGPEAERA